jgi:hypothetical protein
MRLLRSLLLLALPCSLAAQSRTYTWECVGQVKPKRGDTLVVQRDSSRVDTAANCTRRKAAVAAPVPTPTPTPLPAPSGAWALITDLQPVLPFVRPWGIAYDVSSVTVATDPSGLPALAMLFRAGYAGGSSPATVYYEGFSVAKIRWESTLSYPLGYVKHQSSVDKSVFIQVSGRNKMYTMMYDPTRLIPAIGLQEIVNLGVSINLSPNLANVELQRGKRHVLACEATGNTAGQANGIVECWLDGVKFLSRSGIQFTTDAARFTAVAWVPTWGGAGGTLLAPQSVYLGRLRVYGQ